ncbi:MAG: hypothetical protein DSY87_09025 [Methylococcus sp.]|nr:MAG: hypothetical protein DSY87_09025 [Methylococcus sp.]
MQDPNVVAVIGFAMALIDGFPDFGFDLPVSAGFNTLSLPVIKSPTRWILSERSTVVTSMRP